MATLVLSAVGTALGGPIGGAIGALAGTALDHAVLAPKGREGPRLSELRVQTSSYGSAIPRLWGRMRVAGTVIWSTDLIETRASARAGKGQPSVTAYSYAASFAVLLSARPVLGIGRVWADGQLIRGAGGDWKVTTGFRLHLGSEDQAIDPLIASAEESALTPAYRGCAYAVFEQLSLADFGNRIPSLSFEVIADDGPVGVGAIARELAGEVSGGAALSVDGFVAAGDSVRGVLECLATASGAWFAPAGGGLRMRDVAAATGIIDQGGERSGREVAAADTTPAAVSVRHYDPERDWQAGLQRARRAGGNGGNGGTLMLDMPVALSAAAAKGVAQAVLARGEAARVQRTVATTLAALALVPGDAVRVDGEAEVWRIEALTFEGVAVTLTLVPLVPAPRSVPAQAGRALPAPDRVAGTTLLHAVELPPLDDTLLTQPRLAVFASGTGAGWRGAALMLSTDGASWVEVGATAAPATMGVVAVAPGAGSAALIDRANRVVVELARADMMLGDADAAQLDRGANLALIGGELMQFARAEPLGARRWRLSELWRGRRGMARPIAAGDPFVLVEAGAARFVDLPLATLGATVRVMASGVADPEPVVASAAMHGASVLPPAPVGLRVVEDGIGGGRAVAWTRRSRAGWRWLDGVDAPLSEESEAYAVTLTNGAETRALVTSVPMITLTAAERSGTTITITQRGTFGASPTATISIGEQG